MDGSPNREIGGSNLKFISINFAALGTLIAGFAAVALLAGCKGGLGFQNSSRNSGGTSSVGGGSNNPSPSQPPIDPWTPPSMPSTGPAPSVQPSPTQQIPSPSPSRSPDDGTGGGTGTLNETSCTDYMAEQSRARTAYQTATSSLTRLDNYLATRPNCDPCQDGAGPGGEANGQTPPICLDFSAAYDFIRDNSAPDRDWLVAILRGYDPTYPGTCAGITRWMKTEYTDWFVKADQIFRDSLTHAQSVCH